MDDGDDEIPTLGIDLRHPIEGWIIGRTLEATVFWSWYETIKKWGADHAYEMAVQSALMGRSGLTDDERTYLRRWIQTIAWNGDQRPDKETWARRLSYNMLASGDWTRHTAARFASNMLGKKIEESVWRKAVNKWASENGKPQLNLPRGRPAKKNRQNS